MKTAGLLQQALPKTGKPAALVFTLPCPDSITMADTGKRHCVALFTRAELANAFAYVLPPERSFSAANRWFEMLAGGKSDDQGRYVYVDPMAELGLEGVTPEVGFSPPPSGYPSGRGQYDWLIRLSPEEREEALMGFSDVLLDLAAVSSPDIRARVEMIPGREHSAGVERRYRDLQEAAKRLRQ